MLVLALACVMAPAKGLEFTDSSAADFLLGTFTNTTTEGDAVAMGNETSAAYFPSGTFASRVFDPGVYVRWTGVDWNSSLPIGSDVNISFSTGNASSPGEGWESAGTFTGQGSFSAIARYAQYTAFLGANNHSFTPLLEGVAASYEFVPPRASLEKPANNHVTASRDVDFNCSASSLNRLVNVTLYTDINGTWSPAGSSAVSGNSSSVLFTVTNATDGTYMWGCLAADETGESGWSGENRTLVISASDPAPMIVSYGASPGNVGIGGSVELGISATDNSAVDSVWATVTLPNSSKANVTLQNNGIVNYTAALEGSYLVTFFANDTLGSISSKQDSFMASQLLDANITVSDSDSAGLDAEVDFLRNGEVVASFTATGGSLLAPVLEDEYDVLFSVYGGDFMVLFRGVDIAQHALSSVGLERIFSMEGFEEIFAVDDPFGVADGSLTLVYDEGLLDNESGAGLYVCEDWNFTARSCSGSFVPVTGFSHDEAANTIKLNVTGFSAFGIMQEGFCGDGVCGSGETTSSCPGDCECADGETRSCGQTDAGECEFGTQVCADGAWGPCVGEVEPSAEECNQKDDDCDGTVDNVGGGTSPASAACQCYGGGQPEGEVCNGIDDDCDGQVDGFSLPCGSNIGICEEGRKLCLDGIFQECTGGVDPLDEECGNEQDDNCNGQVDEGCPDCFNGIMDGDETGVDCGGSCSKGCPSFPFELLAVAGLLVMVGVYVFLRLFRKRRNWEDLERRYSYSPAR